MGGLAVGLGVLWIGLHVATEETHQQVAERGSPTDLAAGIRSTIAGGKRVVQTFELYSDSAESSRNLRRGHFRAACEACRSMET